MSNSSLATYTLISPNKNSPRNHKIDTISIHCFVGQVTAKRGCEVFQPSSEQASCNYVVGYDGSIGLCVEEKDRSWCTSSSSNDHRAITIETASENKAPNYGSKGAINPGVYTIVAEAGGTGASKWGKLKSGAGWISLDYATKNGTSSSTASKAVTVGSTVTIQAGAVYGGLATSRGAKVPDYVSGKNRRYTVKQIATHKGVQEALLKEITSWVALSYLTVV